MSSRQLPVRACKGSGTRLFDPQAKCRPTNLIFKSSMQYSGACVKFPRTLWSATAHGRLAPPVIHDVHHHHHHDKGPPDMSYSQIGFVSLDLRVPFLSLTFLYSSLSFLHLSLLLDQNKFSRSDDNLVIRASPTCHFDFGCGFQSCLGLSSFSARPA